MGTTVCLYNKNINKKAHTAYDLTLLSKVKDFSKSQAVTFTSSAKVVIWQKQC